MIPLFRVKPEQLPPAPEKSGEVSTRPVLTCPARRFRRSLRQGIHIFIFFIIKINGVRYMYKQCWGAGLFWSRSRQKKTRKMLQNIIVSRYLKSFGWTKLLALALLYFYWLKLGTWQAQNCYNFGFFSTSSSRILSKRWIFTFNSILSLNSVGFFKFFF